MVDEETESLYRLTGEDFYVHIEEQYGKNVGKILRFHDIDSYFILGAINENELIDVFEKHNDENSSEELVLLKKDLCNFLDEKVSLKIGTKGKLILLLKEVHSLMRKKRLHDFAERRSNQTQTPSLINRSSNDEFDWKKCYESLERSITTLLSNVNHTVHGQLMPSITVKHFKIDIKSGTDDSSPVCSIECICGDRVRLYLRNNTFQTSNLVKHLKSTSKNPISKAAIQVQGNSNRELPNSMDVGDDGSGTESDLSPMDDTDDTDQTADNHSNRKSANATSERCRERMSTIEYDKNVENNSSFEKANNFNRRQQPGRNSVKRNSAQGSSSLDNTLRSNTKDVRNIVSKNTVTTLSDNNDRGEAVLTTRVYKASNKRPVHDKMDNTDVLSALLETIDINTHRPPNNYKYPPSVFRFATVLSILAGRHAYEYLRINLRYVLPTIQTIQNNMTYSPYLEAHFRFDEVKASLNSIQCQYIFVSEDCSAIVPRIEYDAVFDVFNGFVTPIIEGIPDERTFRCSTFEELKHLFETIPYSNLVNIHVIQPVVDSNTVLAPAATVLSAYGTNHKITAIDIMKRWLMVYKQFYAKGVRVLGYSTDGDPKYLRAMRLAANFFIKNKTLNLYNDTLAFKVKIPLHWASWYFLNSEQLFLFMQDGVHLCTKLRNRLLSKRTNLIMGSYEVNIEHLHDLIRSTDKLDHNLSISDLNVKDKQNFLSCQKICAGKVLNLLALNDKYRGTYNYLLILNLLVIAYTEKTTLLIERIYCASIVLFYTRMWRVWLHIMKPSHSYRSSDKNGKQKQDRSTQFITSNTLLCIELNAHYLIYIYLLIEQNVLPPYVAENTHLFSSQHCEHVFRNARALSGVYSTRINFTVTQFLKRINKLNILSELKQFEEENDEHRIVFPAHRKIKHLTREHEPIPNVNSTSFSTNDLEKTILQAYQAAQDMAISVRMSTDLIRNNLFNMEQLSKVAKDLLQFNSLTESQIVNVGESTEDEDSSEDDSVDDDNDDEEQLDMIIRDNDSSDEDGLDFANTFKNLKSTSYQGVYEHFACSYIAF